MYRAAASNATAINAYTIKKKIKLERFVAKVKLFINFNEMR